MKLHHVGIVVKSIEESAPQYRQFLGLDSLTPVITDETQRVNVQFLANSSSAPSVELVEPLPGKSPARRKLEQGGGLDHLCFEVADLTEYVRHAESEGVVCVCPPVPAAAFGGRRVAFLLYRGIGLIEFVEADAK